MARSNASSRRTQSRQRRRQFERRGVLSDKTLRMGSRILDSKTKVRRYHGGETLTQQQVLDIPITAVLESARQNEKEIKTTLEAEKRRIAALEHELRSTPKFRLFKRAGLKGSIEQEKWFSQVTRAKDADAKVFRKEIEELMKKRHRAKLERMRRSRGPNLP